MLRLGVGRIPFISFVHNSLRIARMCADRSAPLSIDASQKRLPYNTPILTLQEVDKSPFVQFQKWYEGANESLEIEEPNAMCLSTCGKEGRPSARMVLMKSFSGNGFTFFSNRESRKGVEMADNSCVALLFYWTALKQQVRVEGRAGQVEGKVSDEYWATRPLISRMTAVISQQSKPVSSREELEQRREEAMGRGGEGEERPSHWSGYLVVPDYFEFWQGHSDRMHDRFEYKKTAYGDWNITRLQP